MKVRKSRKKSKATRQGNVDIRNGLEEGRSGRDLSNLSELPQRTKDESARAGAPSPRDQKRKPDRLADES
jgi:hypothetical protein